MTTTTKFDTWSHYFIHDNGAVTRVNQGQAIVREAEIAEYRTSGNWDVYELLERQPADHERAFRIGRYLRTDWRS